MDGGGGGSVLAKHFEGKHQKGYLSRILTNEKTAGAESSAWSLASFINLKNTQKIINVRIIK